MRIALVHPHPWPEVRRGAERYLEDLTSYLAAHDHDVTVITGTTGPAAGGTDGHVTRVLRPHVRFRGMHRLGLSEIETFAMRAVGPLRRARPDVVHAFTPSAALAGRLTRRPTVYTVLGHPDAGQLPATGLVRGLFLSAVRRATVTTVLSRASAAALEATAGAGAVVLPPGVRLDRFVPALDPRRGPPRILFSGSLTDPRKHVELVVAAFAIVLQRHPDARLALSGEGDPARALAGAGEQLRSAVDALGPGTVEDVPGRYREATVTVLPAEHEAFGLVLVESLACGTPAVCTPAGGMPEIVGREVGAVAATTDPGALADAVERALALAADPATPKACVERARRWDWDASVGPGHVRLYEQLLAGTFPPAAVGPW